MRETIEWKSVNENLPESEKEYFCFVEVLIKTGDRIEEALFNTRTRNFQKDFIIVKDVELWCYLPTGTTGIHGSRS